MKNISVRFFQHRESKVYSSRWRASYQLCNVTYCEADVISVAQLFFPTPGQLNVGSKTWHFKSMAILRSKE